MLISEEKKNSRKQSSGFFLNLEIIQLKLLKDLAQISLPADADKRRKNKCKKTLTWFFAKLCTAAPVTVEEKKNRNGR
jgi:hypothetical protein